MAVTLSFLDRFAKFFHCCEEHLIYNKTVLVYPPHLKHVAALLHYLQYLGKLKSQNFTFMHVKRVSNVTFYHLSSRYICQMS